MGLRVISGFGTGGAIGAGGDEIMMGAGCWVADAGGICTILGTACMAFAGTALQPGVDTISGLQVVPAGRVADVPVNV